VSYDLCARADERFSVAVPRGDVSRVVAGQPFVVANGPSGFVLQEGDALWMEIDLESVTEEGDSLELDERAPSATVNCINFHVPYAFTKQLPRCTEVALRIAGSLGWELYDSQTDSVAGTQRARKPWWKFW
jgi:hypothetical protein